MLDANEVYANELWRVVQYLTLNKDALPVVWDFFREHINVIFERYFLLLDLIFKINEPAHDKTYNKTCATSEDSDQPAHPRSLIRVFAGRMCLLRPPGYPKRDKREPLPHWVDVQYDQSLRWSHLPSTASRLYKEE